jgi:hypothetical protein
MRGLLTTLSFAICLISSNSFAWGPLGHETIAVVGAQVTSVGTFWSLNQATLKQLSTVPDRVWKAPSTKPLEEGHHWFEIDSYVGNAHPETILEMPKRYNDAVAKYTAATLAKNGLAPWRSGQFYKMAVAALKAGDLKGAATDVGILCHYVGDLSQPFHATNNYDGQKTGNKGIHAWFETAILNGDKNLQDEVAARAKSLLTNQAFLNDFKGDLMDVLERETLRSYADLDKILQIDTKMGRQGSHDALLEIAKDRLADGAATYALILDRIATEAGGKMATTTVSVPDPQWIQPVFE